jgi:hypothetical protein
MLRKKIQENYRNIPIHRLVKVLAFHLRKAVYTNLNILVINVFKKYVLKLHYLSLRRLYVYQEYIDYTYIIKSQ